MFRTIFNRYSRRLIPKSPGGLRNTSLGATDIGSGSKPQSLKNMLLESPQWENKVEFTLKELVLHNINKRQNDLIEHRITKAENKFLFTTICATCSIICTILSERYFAGKSYDTDNKIADVSGKKDTDKKK
ncbi:hypothetical protein RhiirA1_479776 [Rhizophagus irregularis]|uniref:Uncharacterized protein n=1 Tax=Rhizophagus irregularis TaxID=588596 RepID=A0A2I1F2V5_9GLOM|nr:hypothetical protein RhiirA1_479776 [Rhizophagus irregularis]PKY28695.1 hypothetical protein RhiirB3_391247 [Rhizophagus irregularis]CAB4490875.1 unnamed protein product [Rhizophagus irregularis]CAB5359151.1 unnamed protein product [Rhizophagus irregularis]